MFIYIKMKCVICKEQGEYQIIHTKVRNDPENKYVIGKCAYCNHVQLIGPSIDNSKHYEDDNQTKDIIQNLNLSFEDIINKEKKEIERRITLLKKQDLTFEKKTLLDIGSGYQTFVSRMSQMYPNLRIVSVEPSASRSELGLQFHNAITTSSTLDTNLSIHNSYVDENFVLTHQTKYDYITLWHVLEHIDADHIDDFIQNVKLLVKPGGKIFIEVPNGNDELLKLDSYKNVNYMIHHVSYFTEGTLILLLHAHKLFNYKVQHVQRYSMKNYLNWIYDLGFELKDDMFTFDDNDLNNMWLTGKIVNKNTDAIFVTIVV